MRLLHLLRKELIEIVRQKELLFLMFVAPLIQIVLLGYVITTDVRNIPVQVINLSRSAEAQEMVHRIGSSPLFNLRKASAVNEDVEELLKRGAVKAVVVFRDAAGPPAPALRYPEVQVLMDGVDANTSLIAAGYFNGIIKEYILRDIQKAGRAMPVKNKTLIRYNPRLRSINTMGPGIVAILLTVLTLFVTSLSIVREKEQQTMDALLISRLTPLEIYVGKALPAAVIGLVNMVIGIFVVVLWFGIPVRGSLLVLLLASLIYLAAILAYALFISTMVANQQQAMFFTWFSLITFILLSGFLTPLDNLKSQFPALMILADVNPFRYLVAIIREIFLKGNGIAFFWKELLALAAISVGLTSLSLLNFRKFISK